MSMLFGDSRIDAHDGALGFLFGGALENLQIMQNSSRGIGDVTNAVAYSSAALQRYSDAMQQAASGDLAGAKEKFKGLGMSDEEATQTAILSAYFNGKDKSLTDGSYDVTSALRNAGFGEIATDEQNWKQYQGAKKLLDKFAKDGNVSRADIQEVVNQMAGKEVEIDWAAVEQRSAAMKGVDIKQDRDAQERLQREKFYQTLQQFPGTTNGYEWDSFSEGGYRDYYTDPNATAEDLFHMDPFVEDGDAMFQYAGEEKYYLIKDPVDLQNLMKMRDDRMLIATLNGIGGNEEYARTLQRGTRLAYDTANPEAGGDYHSLLIYDESDGWNGLADLHNKDNTKDARAQVTALMDSNMLRNTDYLIAHSNGAFITDEGARETGKNLTTPVNVITIGGVHRNLPLNKVGSWTDLQNAGDDTKEVGSWGKHFGSDPKYSYYNQQGPIIGRNHTNKWGAGTSYNVPGYEGGNGHTKTHYFNALYWYWETQR